MFKLRRSLLDLQKRRFHACKPSSESRFPGSQREVPLLEFMELEDSIPSLKEKIKLKFFSREKYFTIYFFMIFKNKPTRFLKDFCRVNHQMKELETKHNPIYLRDNE